jgi:hypothetical protein
VEDTVAHNQHPSAEPLRQQFLEHKGNHRYLASIELIDAAEKSRREEGCNLVLHIFNRCAKQVVQGDPKRMIQSGYWYAPPVN